MVDKVDRQAFRLRLDQIAQRCVRRGKSLEVVVRGEVENGEWELREVDGKHSIVPALRNE